uniref:protein O-GlcNAcase n=1 Tax=Acrobeloides nanus TaxID=290746 RepID=A0A914C7W7_9BILA
MDDGPFQKDSRTCDNNDSCENFLCGVVEGFYGRPWTTEQRVDLFKNLKELGMNTYLYAPKDDLKHRAEWRLLYNTEEAALLGSLIKAANINGIKFVYALSPGIDILYSEPKEIEAIQEKLIQVRSLGCSAFALLFDDIETNMNERDKKKFPSFVMAQLTVSNVVFEYIGKPLFFFCPTEYCESRAVPSLEESSYLNTLGENLHTDIHILWTGPRVVSRLLTIEHIRKVSSVLRRKPLIWDNLHANDYDPKRVFLGPFAGRPIELKREVSGLLLNPNCKYEANYIPFFTLAEWNRSGFNDSIETDEESSSHQGKNSYRPEIALKHALEKWLNHFNHGPGPAIPPISQMETQTTTPIIEPSAISTTIPPIQIRTCKANDLLHITESLPLYTSPSNIGTATTITVQSFSITEAIIGVAEAHDHSIPETVNSLTTEYSEPMDSCSIKDEMNSSPMDTGQENKSDNLEWLRRYDAIHELVNQLTRFYRLVIDSPNKSLVQEIFPYIWDAQVWHEAGADLADLLYENFASKEDKILCKSITPKDPSQFYFDKYFGFFLEYGKPACNHLICEEVEDDGNRRIFAILTVIEDLCRHLNSYKDTYLPMIIEKYKTLISEENGEDNDKKLQTVIDEIEKWPLSSNLSTDLFIRCPTMTGIFWRNGSNDAVPIRRLLQCAVATFGLRGSPGFFSVVPNGDRIPLLSKLGLEIFDEFEINDYSIMGHIFATCIGSCLTRESSSAGPKLDHDQLRCFDMDYSHENFLALGYNTGRIYVGKAEIDPISKKLPGEEVRETQKSIICLAWHPIVKSHLCSVFERGRGLEHAVVVYDMNRNNRTSRDIPINFESTIGERCYSAVWFTDDVNCLGISASKSLRLLDMRDSNRNPSSTSIQQPYYGLCSEPMEGMRFAGHYGNVVHIYDRRHLLKPFYELRIPMNESSNLIHRLVWHPHRLFHLSCLTKDSKGIYELVVSSKAYQTDIFERKDRTSDSIKQAIDLKANEYPYHDLSISIPGVSKINSFDWHPTLHNRLVVLSQPTPRQEPNSARHIHVISHNRTVNTIIGNSGDLAYHNRTVNTIIGNSGDLAYVSDTSICILSANKTALDGELIENGIERNDKVPILANRLLSLSPIFSEPNVTLIMQDRAHKGYGYGNVATSFESVVTFSKQVIDEDLYSTPDLKYCWNWVKRMQELDTKLNFEPVYGTKFPGIGHIAEKFSKENNPDYRTDPILFRVRVFTNENREKILQLCGWPSIGETESYRTILEDIAQPKTAKALARAAAIAIFSVQGIVCKEYLERLLEYAKNRILQSEYIEENYSKHLDHCIEYERMLETVLETLRDYTGAEITDYETRVNSISDDHLKSIVKYLARRTIGYKMFLNEFIDLKDIELGDKLLVATIHMDDENFKNALERICAELWETNPLKILLIRGLDDNEKTHSFLQDYAARTNDFQTVSILLVVGGCVKHSPIFKDPSNLCIKMEDFASKNIEYETDKYRKKSLLLLFEYMDLMSKWGLWIERTFLASLIRSGFKAPKQHVLPQAVIACNYCGMPVYPTICDKFEELRSASLNIARSYNTYAQRSRMMSCANCRKPLPKCTICRRHYGSHIELTTGVENIISAIDHWFVWCCHCNHGGHLAHIREWFEEYTVCPASGCDCNCMERDHLLKEQFVESKPKFIDETQREKPPVPMIFTNRTTTE